MSDKELLELAAKAAGVDLQWADMLGGYRRELQEPLCCGKSWNPLTDDGDALRLAVKLQISVSHHGATHVCETSAGQYLSDECDTTGDGMAATRRAIVRAAAKIGRNMK